MLLTAVTELLEAVVLLLEDVAELEEDEVLATVEGELVVETTDVLVADEVGGAVEEVEVVGVELVECDMESAAYPPTAIITMMITTIAIPAILLRAFFSLLVREESMKTKKASQKVKSIITK